MADGSFRWADDVDISDNDISLVGRMGVACTNGVRNIDILRNTIAQLRLVLRGRGAGRHQRRAARRWAPTTSPSTTTPSARSASTCPAHRCRWWASCRAARLQVPMSRLLRSATTAPTGGAFTHVLLVDSTRYQRVTISGNRSDTRVSARPLQLNNIDGLAVTGNTQPMSPAGSNMLNAVNCTAVTYTGNVTT